MPRARGAKVELGGDRQRPRPPGRAERRHRQATDGLGARRAPARCRPPMDAAEDARRPGGRRRSRPPRCRRTIRSRAGRSRWRPRCPARTPIIQASPSTPPPPRTRMSGGLSIAAVRLDVVGGRPKRRHSSRLYVITYTDMALADHTIAPEALGVRIRALREAMDLSLRDLAERSGSARRCSRRWSAARRARRCRWPRRIARGLELRLSQLLRLDEEGAVSVVRAGERRQGPARAARPQLRDPRPRRCPASAPSFPATRLAPGAVTGGPGDPPMHEPGSRETALVAVRHRRAALRRCALRARPPATASPSTPTFPTISRTPEIPRPSCSRW